MGIFDNINDKDLETQSMYIGTVVSNKDANNSGKLYVRIGGQIDGHIENDTDEALSAVPLLPRFFHSFPKEGDRVFVFMHRTKKTSKKFNHGAKYWVGPIISQLPDLNLNDTLKSTSRDRGGVIQLAQDIANKTEAKGAYAGVDDIAINGRDNTDILLRTKEICLRAGKFVINENTKFNNINPAYIQLKYGSSNLKKQIVDGEPTQISRENRDSTGSVINVVADKINLITHLNNLGLNVTNNETYISEDEQAKVNSEHPLVRGDELVTFLKLLTAYVTGHVHNYSHKAVANTTLTKELLLRRDNLENDILNKNIRIN